MMHLHIPLFKSVIFVGRNQQKLYAKNREDLMTAVNTVHKSHRLCGIHYELAVFEVSISKKCTIDRICNP